MYCWRSTGAKICPQTHTTTIDSPDTTLLADSGILGDLWSLDFQSLRWTKIYNSESTEMIPSSRRSMGFAAIGPDVILIFGGKSDHGALNDTFKFHASDQRFEKVTSTTAGPTPRYDFGFTVSTEGKAYVVGGFANSKEETGSWVDMYVSFGRLPDGNKQQLDLANDDVYEFDPGDETWTKLSNSVWMDAGCICSEPDIDYNRHTCPASCYFDDENNRCSLADEAVFRNFCQDYVGLSRFPLVYHPSGKLRIIGGHWYLPRPNNDLGGRLTWAEYDLLSRTWTFDEGNRPDVWHFWQNDPKYDPNQMMSSELQKSPVAVSDPNGNIFLLATILWLNERVWMEWQDQWFARNDFVDLTNCGSSCTYQQFFGATLCGERLYAFGGGLNYADEHWSNLDFDIGFQYWDRQKKWERHTTKDWATGTLNTPLRNRYGHGMVSTTNKIFIFGGTFGNLNNRHSGNYGTDNRIIWDWPSENFEYDPRIRQEMGVRYGECFVFVQCSSANSCE